MALLLRAFSSAEIHYIGIGTVMIWLKKIKVKSYEIENLNYDYITYSKKMLIRFSIFFKNEKLFIT